jgi:putative salt-induced outer membrane protein YdiY
MSSNIRITGLEELQRDFEDAARAMKSLDGTIATLSINPDDPSEAIRQMELAIDSKIAAYRGNTLVSQLAREMKAQYRQRILELSRTQEK